MKIDLNKRAIIIVAAVIFFVGMTIVAASYGMAKFLEWRDPVGYRNIGACQELRPGISLNEIVKFLGEPYRVTDQGQTNWYYFQTPSINAGPIRAQARKSDGKILILRCFEDGPPTWETDPS